MLLNPELKANRAALLLVDMQNEFLRPDGPLAKAGLLPVNPADRKEFIANTTSLIKAIRKINRPVVYVNTAFRPDHKDCFLSPPWLDAVIGDSSCLVEGSRSAAILDELKPEKSDFVLAKKGHSPFQHTYLDRLLKSLNVETCIVAGNLLGSMDEAIAQGTALGYEVAPVPDASYPLRSPHWATLHGNPAFTPATAEVLAWIKETSGTPAEKSVSKPALIIVDIQNDHMHPEGGSLRLLSPGSIPEEKRQEIIQNNLKLAAAMRARGLPVIYIQSTRGRNPADTAEAKTTRRGRPLPPGLTFLIEGTWGAEILEDVKPQPGDLLVIKRGHGGFGTTHLHRLLRNLGVDTIIMTGGAITGCVAATTREGVGLGYHAIVIPDATYSPGSRIVGAAALASRAEIKTTEEMLAELEQGILPVGKSR